VGEKTSIKQSCDLFTVAVIIIIIVVLITVAPPPPTHTHMKHTHTQTCADIAFICKTFGYKVLQV